MWGLHHGPYQKPLGSTVAHVQCSVQYVVYIYTHISYIVYYMIYTILYTAIQNTAYVLFLGEWPQAEP